MDFDDFVLDDNIFASDAGINKITEAYAKVFKNIKDLASEGEAFAEAGSDKEVASIITQLTAKTSALVQITTLDKKIVNSNGTVFNVFGQELSAIDDDSENDDSDEDTMSESDLISELNNIIDGCTNISFSEVMIESKNKENIEDDNQDHGDLDLLW